MIRFALKCDHDHQFESWFGSNADYDRLRAAGHVSCAICGSTEISKDLMAPAVSPNTKAPAPLSAPATHPAEQALAELKKHVETTADYVGGSFAKEARDIHDGVAPDRPIYGEAKLDDARKLIDDGIPVAPLPFTPKQKAN